MHSYFLNSFPFLFECTSKIFPTFTIFPTIFTSWEAFRECTSVTFTSVVSFTIVSSRWNFLGELSKWVFFEVNISRSAHTSLPVLCNLRQQLVHHFLSFFKGWAQLRHKTNYSCGLAAIHRLFRWSTATRSCFCFFLLATPLSLLRE